MKKLSPKEIIRRVGEFAEWEEEKAFMAFRKMCIRDSIKVTRDYYAAQAPGQLRHVHKSCIA